MKLDVIEKAHLDDLDVFDTYKVLDMYKVFDTYKVLDTYKKLDVNKIDKVKRIQWFIKREKFTDLLQIPSITTYYLVSEVN